MRILYLDCFAGISGDMALGAFLDLGVKKESLVRELEKLKLEGYKLEISQKGKNGIMGTDVNVILDQEGQDKTPHRNLTSIEKLIDESDLDQAVKSLSKDIFMKVAQAESKIHGKAIEEVHFHEIGAVDSILDIVGVAICLNTLEVDTVMSSPLHTGTGFVHCQHGVIPVPAPATLEILRASKVPFYSKGIAKELVTPTGAAIVATIADKFGPMPEGQAVAVGYGTGKRDLKIANLLRMVLIEGKKKRY